MATIGSVFLGDVQRVRVLSSPPSSPPPNMYPASFSHISEPETASTFLVNDPMQNKPAPPSIPPILSLDLRIRWLETLVYGTKQDAKVRHMSGSSDAGSLLRGVEQLRKRMDNIVRSNDGLRRFLDHYEQHAHLLAPSFALSGIIPTSPPPYENMSPSELEAFLAEMEPDVRAAERDLREIEMLEKKDVTAAGKLPDYEALQPRLEQLLNAHEADIRMAADLERRIAALMDRYATNVDTLSELFVAWDETIRGAEDKVNKLEREHEQRSRLGY